MPYKKSNKSIQDSAFKMKGSAFYGKGNQSPKSKDPIGDWFRKAGKQLRDDFGKGGNLEKDIQKKSDAVGDVVSTVGGNVEKGVENLKSGIETGVQKVKEGFNVGRPGHKSKELKITRSLNKAEGDLKNLHNFLQGKRKYNKETKKWEDK